MNPARLVDLFSEVVMLVLGLLLLLLALGSRYGAPSGLRLWPALGAVLVIWGARTWFRKARSTQTGARAMRWLRGGSLVLAGALMLAMTWLPAPRAHAMLAVVGVIVALRGLLGAALAARGLSA